MNQALIDYKKLKLWGTEIQTLHSILKLLEWDQKTVMPKKGASFRADQMAHLSSLIHKKKTSSAFKKTLKRLIDLKTGTLLHPTLLDEEKKRALIEFRTAFLQDIKLSSSFIKKWTKATCEGVEAWQRAKEKNAFADFLPHLETITHLAQKKAELLGYKDHPYDALLNLYEPGMTTKKLDLLFETLKPFLKTMGEKLSEKKERQPLFLSKSIPMEEQLPFFKELLELIGLHADRYSLGTSVHPFCLGVHYTDIRLTTFPSPASFFTNLSALMHEAGHALYEQNLPHENFGTPIASSCSIGIHESQSHFWECFIGKNRPFLEFLTPKIKKKFPKAFDSLSSDFLFSAINQVQSSPIRISADEVTYLLHIIIRYEIEKQMLTQSIDLQTIPKIWNSKMEQLLGIAPKTDREGCLQDIHWSLGYIGYFPTYALGTLYAAQLFATFKRESPQFETKICNGLFSEVSTFLLKKIHRHGKNFPPLTLIEQATGSPLCPQAYMDYLTKKYFNS